MKKLYIIFGLPWSGKTTLTEYLMDAFGKERCVQISPDNIRKELFPIPEYNKSVSWKIWEESIRRAHIAMQQEKIVFWDAVFWHEHKRKEAVTEAKKHGYICEFVYVSCENEVSIEERLARRINSSSDADFEIYQKLKAFFQYPEIGSFITINNSSSLEDFYREIDIKILNR